MGGEKCSKETVSRLDGEQILHIPVFENCSLLGFFKYCSYYFSRRVSKNYEGKVLVKVLMLDINVCSTNVGWFICGRFTRIKVSIGKIKMAGRCVV